ncbi:MAG: hybrid sensor histidine kinase/response regulator [bacterium]|nr:hybrid sensor histidine kinase/response regulator [bacterium]
MNALNAENYSILIVDDVPQNIQVLGNILRKENYRVAFAVNGKEALLSVKVNRFDLILMDIMMPEMNGFEACSHIKKDPGAAHIPLIFLTAKEEANYILKGFEVGAADYLVKPFNSIELLARIRPHLELKRAEDRMKAFERDKEAFYSIMGRSLRNPLGTLVSASQMLDTHYDNYDDKKRKQDLGKIKESAKEVQGLLENVIQWSRTRLNAVDFSPCRLDLSGMTASVFRLLEGIAEERHVRMSSDIAKETYVTADTDMLALAMRNLVSTALQLADSATTLEIRSVVTGKFRVLTLAFKGQEINKDKLQKEMGIMLSREFIEKHGGKLSFRGATENERIIAFSLPIT